MKKLLLTLVAVVFVGSYAMAQTDQGSIMLGGNLGLNINGNSTTTDPASPYEIDRTTTAYINPQAGYFVSDNFAIGLGVNANFVNDKLESYDEDEELQATVSDLRSTFGGNLFARYYVRPADMLGIFGQLSIGGGVTNNTETTTNEITGDETEIEGDPIANLNIGIQPGLTFFPSENWGIDLLVGRLGFDGTYQTSEDETTDIETQNSTANIDFGIDFTNVRLGVYYYF
ncbi:MAG: outer membrane beta-barrel protein [Bacteroidota bacterium]